MSMPLASYPFEDPDAKELREQLTAIYFTQDPIITIVRTARLKPQAIKLADDAEGIWDQALDQAAQTGKLVDLLNAVRADSQSLSLHPLIDRMIQRFGTVRSAQAAQRAFDFYELAVLSPTRSFIGRRDLRKNLKEFEKTHGARVLVVLTRPDKDQVGRSHSWFLINEIGQRLKVYDAYRFDLTDWSGPPQEPRDVWTEVCVQLGWDAPLDPAAQPDAVVRLAVTTFKRLGRTLPGRTCLVFDGYTAAVADDWARALVVGIAAAANAGEAGNVCVALLEVDARLTSDLARDAVPEYLPSAGVADLEEFFTAAAAANGIRIPPEQMPLLVEKVLGPPPYADELPLRTIGPKAAQVASVFGDA